MKVWKTRQNPIERLIVKILLIRFGKEQQLMLGLKTIYKRITFESSHCAGHISVPAFSLSQILNGTLTETLNP